MKTFKLSIIFFSIIAFVSCSTNNSPALDDAALFDVTTRVDSTQNDSTDDGGFGATIKPREKVTTDGVASEVPYD